MPGFTFPPVGPLGLGSPPSRPSYRFGLRYYDPLRLPLLHLGALRLRSIPDTLRSPPFVSLAFRRGSSPVRAWPFFYPGLPVPVCLARRWRSSRVPRLPLCAHAPLADPGGVLSTRHAVSRTHAFRRSQTVGFPRLAPSYPLGPQL